MRMKFDFRVGNLILQVNSSQTQVVRTAQASEGPAPKMSVFVFIERLADKEPLQGSLLKCVQLPNLRRDIRGVAVLRHRARLGVPT